MTKVRFGVYMEQSRRDKADAMAKELGLTFNGLVNVALNEYIKQQNAIDMMEVYKIEQSKLKGRKSS